MKSRSVRRIGRRRRRRAGIGLTPVAVLPYAINWSTAASAGGTHDIHPATTSASDNIFRASSTVVTMAANSVCAAQIVLYASNTQQLATRTLVIGPTPRTFRVRAPRTIDYSSATATYWRYIVTGPATIAGVATFTLKETISE